MKHVQFQPTGVCSKLITFDLDDEGRVHNISFMGGCPGNTTGVSLLAEGRSADELVRMLSGVKCGFKNTSCPAQFAEALANAIGK
ncbi:MAG: TIGR03905 family TSCPD domain-containing protein [Prevotella sp.]|nr:TIGR03905 family TSCPD domain-containing protein [Prevotella sp.]